MTIARLVGRMARRRLLPSLLGLIVVATVMSLSIPMARADEPLKIAPTNLELRQRGHHKKVVGASLIIVGSLFDAATTALTFTGLARGGWSITPKSSPDTALLWTGVAGGLVLDSILTAGIVIYCDGGQLMHKADTR